MFARSLSVFPCLAVIVCGLVLFATTAAAQINTGEISGVVRDVQGGTLPGARVIAEHVESGGRTESLSDESGRYHLPSLRVGMYVISVELDGFRRVVRSGFLVQLGQTLTQNFTLDVGGLVEEIRVTATFHGCKPRAPRSATSSKTRRSYSCRSTGATSSLSRN